jgi:ABC-type branched-subunit amino acid transport system permease subunit
VAADIVMFSLVLREFGSFVKAIRENDAEMAFGKHTFLYKIWQDCWK